MGSKPARHRRGAARRTSAHALVASEAAGCGAGCATGARERSENAALALYAGLEAESVSTSVEARASARSARSASDASALGALGCARMAASAG